VSELRPADPIEEARRQWLVHWGNEPAPSMTAVTSIMRAQQILMARLNALLSPLGLTFPRYEALMLLYYSRRGSLPLGKVGSRLQVHPTSVTNLIDRLERSGLVRREPHEHDRRTTLAAITDDGRRLAKEATAILNEARFGTEPLGVPELEQLWEVLRPLRASEGDFPLP
jgi:DNA-binding MarR family transcriptional regulator